MDRCIYALVNEGARILEEGYALRPVDIDIIYLTGYGFPAYRGGPMWYADTVGLKKVYERIQEFQRQHGEFWEPAPLLKRLAEEGKTFADFNKEKGAARMREAVVVTSSRTALAKSFRGSFNMTRPDDLAAHCIRDVLRKTPQLDPEEIEDVILGCGQPHGPQGTTWRASQRCSPDCRLRSPRRPSTASALPDCRPSRMAAHQIMNEGADAAIGGGVESITHGACATTDPNPR